METLLTLINQVWEIERKANQHDFQTISRNLKRMHAEFESLGYTVIDPMGRPYKETDTDIEANLTKAPTKKSCVSKVMKPIIYKTENGVRQLLQKGIVIID